MGRIRINRDQIGLFLVAVSLLAIFAYLTGGYAADLGFNAAIGTNLTAIFPGLFVTILGLVSVARGGPLAIGGFGAIGIGLAVLFGEMYTVGIITSGILAGATIVQVQTITIVVALLMGGVAYATQKR
jgi:hypothetical protein